MDLLAGFKRKLEAECRHSPVTIEGYIREVAEFLRYWESRGKPQFDGQLVNDHLVRLWNQFDQKPKTLNRKRMAIRQFYQWLGSQARQHGEYGEERRIETQLACIDPIKNVRKIRTVIGPEDLRRIIAACKGETAPRNRAMILLIYSGAVRVSEMCGLNLRDVLHTTRKLRIMGKGSRDRLVPVSGECLKVLQDYVEGWRTRHAKPDNPALFVSVDGERVGRYRITHLLLEKSRRLSLKQTTSHTLRRSRATTLMDSGQPIEKIQRFLGHKTIDATQQYLSVSLGRLRAVYAKCHPRDQGDFGVEPEIRDEFDGI